MSLVAFAEHELSLIPEDEGDEMQSEMNKCILDIVKIFADQGHSGMSAAYAIGALEKLLRFEPLKPLTGDDSEWTEVTDGTFQNKRCPHVFKEDGKAYDIEGKIFRDPDGCCYTSSDSRVYITFPYTPTREYVDRPE